MFWWKHCSFYPLVVQIVFFFRSDASEFCVIDLSFSSPSFGFQLFEFADKYRGKYDSSITVAQKYYRSVSGYNVRINYRIKKLFFVIICYEYVICFLRFYWISLFFYFLGVFGLWRMSCYGLQHGCTKPPITSITSVTWATTATPWAEPVGEWPSLAGTSSMPVFRHSSPRYSLDTMFCLW